MSTLAVFLVLGGGTALAAYVVSSNSQIGPGTVSGHKPPTGKHANIIAGSINGQDIADRSGVDTCQGPFLAKYGPICVGSDGGARTFDDATNYCADLGLRLPSYTEAVGLARNYDVPGVGFTELFWTDEEFFYQSGGVWYTEVVAESGGRPLPQNEGQSYQTVCVTDPSA
jgi:hypothetical protein